MVPTTINSLGPIQYNQIIKWLAGPLQSLKTELKFYENVDFAYLILPDTTKLKDSLPCLQGYVWSRLGGVFIELFHSRPWAKNALYRVLTDLDWSQYFHPNLPELEKVQEDLFIIGYHQKTSTQDPRWVLCLAADIDMGLDKLSLEFISESLNKKRFELITDYVNWLRKDSPQKLQNLLIQS